MKLSINSPCPCGSDKKYKKCCQVFHKGKFPSNALELMKSRYSAFAFKDVNYIMKTTHKENPDFTTDKENWRKDILSFCNNTEFIKLDILEFIDGDKEAFVKFKATIEVNGKDGTFTEKSRFFKVDNLWQYHSGEFDEK